MGNPLLERCAPAARADASRQRFEAHSYPLSQDINAGHPGHRGDRLPVQLSRLAHRRRIAVGGDAGRRQHARHRLRCLLCQKD
eukprot:scaffold188_cov107-Isochrysis_galbana.AAC.7